MSDKTIVVFGATGQQGSSVVSALLGKCGYAVRAVTRDATSDKAAAPREQGAEVVSADLNVPDTLAAAMQSAYGAFLVTNFWDPSTGAGEQAQVENAVNAAKAAGVSHFIWSTLPNVRQISDGKYNVVHFTNKADANQIVTDAGFTNHSFVEAPSFFQNFVTGMGPQPTGEGDQKAWTVPIDPQEKCVHAGDITNLGPLVAAALDTPEKTGQGQILSLAAAAYSWQDFADTLNAQGHNVIVNQVPGEIYDTFFPGASEIREMMSYFADYSYFGPEADKNVAAAQDLIGAEITDFSTWAKANMPA